MGIRIKGHKSSVWRVTALTYMTLICCAIFPTRMQALPERFMHDTISIYASNDFPPYEYTDGSGKEKGFNIDVIREIMKDMGATYKITMTSWKSVLEAYDQGKADIILGMSYSDERAKKYHFGMNYTSLFQAIVFRKHTEQYKKLAQLKNKKVMVDKGDILEDFAHSEGLDREIIPTTNLVKGLHELSEGKIDAVLCSREVALYLIDKEDISNLDINNLSIPPLEYGYAGSDPLLINDMDNALIKVKSDGELEKLYRKWFYSENPEKLITAIIISVSVVILCCCVFFIFIFMLRRKVDKAKKIIGLQSSHIKLALHAGNVEVWRYEVREHLFFNVECYYFADGGTPFEEVIKTIHPDDRDTFTVIIDKLSKTVMTSTTILLRVDKNQTGEYHHLQVEFAQIKDEEGNIETIIGSFRDMTDNIRKAEDMRLFTEKMNYVLKSSKTVIWEYNIENHQITLYDGLNSVIKVITCYDYFKMLEGKDREEAVALYQMMDKGEAAPFSNIRCINNGILNESEECYAIFNGIPLFDKEHKVISYFGLRRDVTALIQIQIQLEKEKSKAQVADKLKSAFLANMSHEIRTPLNAIVGFSNLLPTIGDTDEKDQFINIINTNSDMLLNLINDILCLSKIEAGIIEIKNADFNMAQTFDVLAQSLRQHAHNPEVEFICDNPYHKCIINSDSSRIVQVLTNFATNAMKNTHKGHVKMGYRCDDGSITIYVEDTGIGIPADKRDVIFNRFEKLNEFVQGTGLGLSICKAITDSCGGKIWVTSELGKGSTFFAEIPCPVISKE